MEAKMNIKKMLVLFTILVFSLKIYSHSPTKIEMDFNIEDKILNVEVHHPVLAQKNHYIEKIEVYLNDKPIIVQNFDAQIEKKTQKAVYFIFEAKKDDIIKVKAFCNKHGDKTVSLVVQEKK
jgi:desulfoferrodoxin (superoxide reductase-like protein)